MVICIIVAMDELDGIGYRGKLPWKCPEDMEHFKKTTSGHAVVMGRKTYESIGHILKNRQNYILTRDPNYKVKGAVIVCDTVTIDIPSSNEEIKKVVVNDINDRKTGAKVSIATLVNYYKNSHKKLFVIGGAETYKIFLEHANVFYVTLIPGTYDCDTKFPLCCYMLRNDIFKYKTISKKFLQTKSRMFGIFIYVIERVGFAKPVPQIRTTEYIK